MEEKTSYAKVQPEVAKDDQNLAEKSDQKLKQD